MEIWIILLGAFIVLLNYAFLTQIKVNFMKGLYSGAAPLSEQTFNYFLSLDLPIQVQDLPMQVYHDGVRKT